MRIHGPLLISLFLAGCGVAIFGKKEPPTPSHKAPCRAESPDCLAFQIATPDTVRPMPRDGEKKVIGPSLVEGKTVQDVDTTSNAEKAKARAVETTTEEVLLGTTIAALGDVSEQGFWLKTPLVKTQTAGRIVWTGSGATLNVTLVPLEGESGAGSQISLAAMRELGVPLTDLPELQVFKLAKE